MRNLYTEQERIRLEQERINRLREEAAQILYGCQECDLCGRVGRDVHLRPVVKAQAGAGSTLTLQCEDVTACWLRAEAKQKEARA